MNINLYQMKFSDPNEFFLNKVIPILHKNIQEKVHKKRFLLDKWKVALANLLIRKILSNELKISSDIYIEYDHLGKPFLADKKRHFNLSYSQEIIVFATDNSPLGIDVEYIRHLSDLDHLLNYFAPEEQLVFQQKNFREQIEFFYELWTLKESYLKALGKGFRYSMQSFCFNFSEKEVCLSRGIVPDKWFFKLYTFKNEYKCAICAKQKKIPKKAVIVEVEELLKPYL